MKPITPLILVLLLVMAACETGTQPAPQPKEPAPEKVYTIADFTDTLSMQDRLATGAIENALQLYNTMVPPDSTAADSAASALLQFINGVVAAKNDSLLIPGNTSRALPDTATSDLNEQQKKTISALHANQLKAISDGEGGVHLVPLYEVILPGIKDRTTAAVDTYLDLVAKEDSTPTFLDAGLAVEIEELADRLATSEQLLGQQLPEGFKSKTRQLNRFYTRAFLIGSDNSPSLEYNTTDLREKFKNGYAYFLAKYPSTKAADAVKTWTALAASGDRKKMDDFRKAFP
ncbi:MAG TPA: hypothetical protein VGE06_09425 [Flavisolibacter sp.]